MIEVENLVFDYPGKRVLHEVSFKLAAGSVTALVGPNGAGKTTLMRCIAGLETPVQGRVTIAGIEVGLTLRKTNPLLGYVSDQFGLYDSLTVTQNLLYAACSHGAHQHMANKQVHTVLDLLDLRAYEGQLTHTLSRGWRQRVGIGMALVHQPKMVLLDEPASGLDPEARFALSALFKTLQTQGVTLCISSHILNELEEYCTQMIVLKTGRIVMQCQADKTQGVRLQTHYQRAMSADGGQR